MQTVTLTFTILPGKEAEAEAAIKKVVEGVDKNEPGAVAYFWHRAVKDPSQVLVFEIWKDDDALEAHRGTHYLNEFQSLFSTMFDEASVKRTRYERIAAITR
jgi:quinol monooxygenase YgiN